MNISLKLLTISIACLVMSACTTSSSLFSNKKTQTVNLHQLNENISIASADARKLNDFRIVQIKTNDFSSNKVLKNALDHYLLDRNAFSDKVVVNEVSEKNVQSSDLTPFLTPSITMSDDYRVITVLLTATTDQSQRIYSSKKVVANGTLSQNKQYATNNPIALKEQIVNGLYDVAQQFADDFNKK